MAAQDENEEMGRELGEGRVHGLERQLALGRAALEEMRGRYLELEDHCHVLDAEAEDLHQQVCCRRRTQYSKRYSSGCGRGGRGS